MSLLKEDDKKAVRERLAALTGKVKIVNFTQEFECNYCRETRELLRDVSELSEKIDLEVLDFVADAAKAKELKVDKIPATVIIGEKTPPLRFYGIPAGYEFISLLHAIEMAGNNHHGLSGDTVQKISHIDQPVHLQVFVTPTCPYCPSAVVTAHQLSLANPHITADMVEATEFPDLAQRYSVRGVPRVVINEKHHFEGALPEGLYIRHILDAIDTSSLERAQ